MGYLTWIVQDIGLPKSTVLEYHPLLGPIPRAEVLRPALGRELAWLGLEIRVGDRDRDRDTVGFGIGLGLG